MNSLESMRVGAIREVLHDMVARPGVLFTVPTLLTMLDGRGRRGLFESQDSGKALGRCLGRLRGAMIEIAGGACFEFCRKHTEHGSAYFLHAVPGIGWEEAPDEQSADEQSAAALDGRVWRAVGQLKDALQQARARGFRRRNVDSISDSYVASLLGSRISELPPELVALKRAQLKVHRSINKKKQTNP